MRMKVYREPCYFAEAVYLLYFFVNHISYEEDYNRVNQYFGHRSLSKEEDMALRRVQELTRIAELATADLDPEDERLRYYFAHLPGMDKKNACCLAQSMLLTVPLQCSDLDEFARNLISGYDKMMKTGLKINDLNGIGLVVEPWDGQEELEPLAIQLDRLPCDLEAKWRILRALTDYVHHVEDLKELLRPVADKLSRLMGPLVEMNEDVLRYWEDYFRAHTMDDFQREMFNSTFLFPEENVPHEVWLCLWYFNFLGTWTEWLDNIAQDGKPVRIIYIGMCISFDYAAHRRTRPDTDTLCAMLRGLSGKDNLDTLRLCMEKPISAARLTEAMHLNSGSVSRNLYALYKLGFLETRGDGKRVNYQTKLEALQQLFGWITSYVEGQ